jgi:hypothetical protein
MEKVKNSITLTKGSNQRRQWEFRTELKKDIEDLSRLAK